MPLSPTHDEHDIMSNDETVVRELIWLKRQVRTAPSHWAHSRIAELEGWLAAGQEKAAWDKTRKLIAKFQSSD